MSKRFRFVWDDVVTHQTFITANDEAEARQLFEEGDFTSYSVLHSESVFGYEVEETV